MRLGQAAAAAAVGIAVLAGCSNGGTANETLPPVSSSAAPTSEALKPLGPTDFPVPAAARADDLAGASAFVDYYINLMSRAQTGLSTEGLRELSSDCEVCTVFADGIDSFAEAQYNVTGGGIKLDGASDPIIINERAEFAIALTQSSMDVLAPNGDRLDDLSAEATAYPASGAALVWSVSQSSWLMAELTIQ